MNATNVLDDYLGELLLDIAPAAPACKPGAVAVAVPAPQAGTEAPAEEVMAKTKASEPQQAGPTVVAFAPPPALIVSNLTFQWFADPPRSIAADAPAPSSP